MARSARWILTCICALAAMGTGAGCESSDESSDGRTATRRDELLTVDLSVTATGNSVTVTYTDMVPSNSNWIAIAKPTDPANVYTAWAYTDGLAAGALTFLNIPPGTYVARAFENWLGTRSYTITQQSEQFDVTQSPTTLTPPASVGHYQPITVDFVGMPPSGSAWIGLYTAGAPDTSFLMFRHTQGLTTGSVTFAEGLPPGTYVARGFNDNGYTRVGESATFNVIGTLQPSVSTTSSTYAAGASVVVTYADLPGNKDWVALYQEGATSDSDYIVWKPTGGGPSGTVTFAGGLAPGNYFAKAFTNNSYDHVATSTAFSVTGTVQAPELTVPTTITANTAFAVNFSNFLGYSSNWIAIGTAGSNPNEYVVWAWAPATGGGSVAFPGLPAGDYVARAFFNWPAGGYEVQASVEFQVVE